MGGVEGGLAGGVCGKGQRVGVQGGGGQVGRELAHGRWGGRGRGGRRRRPAVPVGLALRGAVMMTLLLLVLSHFRHLQQVLGDLRRRGDGQPRRRRGRHRGQRWSARWRGNLNTTPVQRHRRPPRRRVTEVVLDAQSSYGRRLRLARRTPVPLGVQFRVANLGGPVGAVFDINSSGTTMIAGQRVLLVGVAGVAAIVKAAASAGSAGHGTGLVHHLVVDNILVVGNELQVDQLEKDLSLVAGFVGIQAILV